MVSNTVNNKSNRNISCKIKILPKDKELIELIGEERQLIKEVQDISTEIFEIKANTIQTISGIIKTEIPMSKLDDITHGFKDFEISLYYE